MCLTVENLFNNKDVILSREDILKIVKYALENEVVSVTFDDSFRNYEYGIEGRDIEEIDYSVTLKEDE